MLATTIPQSNNSKIRRKKQQVRMALSEGRLS